MSIACNELQEYISAEVDGRLDEDKKSTFYNHIETCSRCNSEFVLERATKSLIRSRLKPVHAPQQLKERILRQLDHEKENFFQRYILSHIADRQMPWKLTLALGSSVVVIVILLLLIPSANPRHIHTAPNDENIVNQTYNNFDNLLNGKLTPQFTSEDPKAVQTFFDSQEHFPIHLPPMKNCALVGASFNRHGHEGAAQLVFKKENNFIYLYEVKLQDMLDNDALWLSSAILNELYRSGWYFENHHPECTLVIRLIDSTIYCAIADINRQQLLTCLTESEY